MLAQKLAHKKRERASMISADSVKVTATVLSWEFPSQTDAVDFHRQHEGMLQTRNRFTAHEASLIVIVQHKLMTRCKGRAEESRES